MTMMASRASRSRLRNRSPGWSRSSASRNVGDEHEPRTFATYAAVAIATIGTLPDTLIDRAVIVDLKRRLLSEKITPFRLDRTETLDMLARKIARWAEDYADVVAALDPTMPPGMINGSADNWRPLIAIANAVGGEWPERARRAALAAKVGDEEGSQIELLLGDIRDIFDALGGDRIGSETLTEKLTEIEGRPWAEFGHTGRPITQNKLARLLKRPGIGVAPDNIRSGDHVVRGYMRLWFDEAFSRFLGEKGVSNRYTATNADNTGTSGHFQSATGDEDVAVPKSRKPNNDWACSIVAVKNAGNGHAEAFGLSNREYADRIQRHAADHLDLTENQLISVVHGWLNDHGVLPEHIVTEAARIMDRALSQ